jgi:hypothetical protein
MTAYRLGVALGAWLPVPVWAHAFDERFDLPAPLAWFIAGAAATVALSFVVAALFIRPAHAVGTTQGTGRGRTIVRGAVVPVLRCAGRAVSLPLLALVVVAGLFGTPDPLMNIAPSMVWVVCWVGLSLVVACAGNLWPAVDPWRCMFEGLDGVARVAGRKGGVSLGVKYPDRLGQWPAVILLLGLGWFELVYPQAAIPYRIACALLAWSVFTLGGMIVFGLETWQRQVDVFAIYFDTLGRFAPLRGGGDHRAIELRAVGSGLIETSASSNATIAFVIAMLSIVLFDGLLVGDFWQAAQHWLAARFPWLRDTQGYLIGGIGLLGVWLAFLSAYLFTCLLTTPLAAGLGTLDIARRFALTLVPIAVGYNIAHNFPTLVIQLQLLIPLASDPLGLHWNLFGTVHYRPDIGLIDAEIAWLIAIAAIVGGHVVSIWLAHLVALKTFAPHARAVAAAVPLAVLMVLYTSISLSVIAEPLVVFTPPGETPPEAH